MLANARSIDLCYWPGCIRPATVINRDGVDTLFCCEHSKIVINIPPYDMTIEQVKALDSAVSVAITKWELGL